MLPLIIKILCCKLPSTCNLFLLSLRNYTHHNLLTGPPPKIWNTVSLILMYIYALCCGSWLCRFFELSINLIYLPFVIIVHSIQSVPFCIQLSKCIPDLNGFRSRSFEDDIWLFFMNDCNLLAESVQLVFDILQIYYQTFIKPSKKIKRMKS